MIRWGVHVIPVICIEYTFLFVLDHSRVVGGYKGVQARVAWA